MNKIFAGICVFILVAVFITAGCVSEPAKDPVIGTWIMDTQDDFIRYYEYVFNSDLTGAERIRTIGSDEIFMEDTYTWYQHNNSFITTFDSDADIHVTLTLSKDGKTLTDDHGYTYHKK